MRMSEHPLFKSHRFRRLAAFAAFLFLCALIIIVIVAALMPTISHDDFGNLLRATPTLMP